MGAPKDTKKREEWIKNLKENRADFSGKNNGRWVEKIEWVCPVCETIKMLTPFKAKKRQFCSRKCAMSGKNHPMYGKKGKDNQNYGQKRTEEVKKKIRENRNHKPDCQCFYCRGKRGETFGENHSQFINEHIYDNSGRCFIWINAKRIRRARYIAELFLKRKLTSTEIIHHINSDCSDDHPENLYLFPNTSEHMRHHRWKNPPILKSNLI